MEWTCCYFNMISCLNSYIVILTILTLCIINPSNHSNLVAYELYNVLSTCIVHFEKFVYYGPSLMIRFLHYKWSVANNPRCSLWEICHYEVCVCVLCVLMGACMCVYVTPWQKSQDFIYSTNTNCIYFVCLWHALGPKLRRSFESLPS